MMAAPGINTADNIRRAFLWACSLDVMVAKPGNVSIEASGHGMTAGLFLASAEASAPELADAGAGVGTRIERAVMRTRAAAGCNTNLGILLLCAPLAAACERLGQPPDPERLHAALETVLAGLTVADAQAAYRGIALASPGGLGEAPDQDVSAIPTIDLRSAMRLAALRDTIARQYANGYADLFTLGLPVLRRQLARRAVWPDPLAHAVLAVYLAFLARFPDSHIVRKHGLEVAQSVTRQARAWDRHVATGHALDLPGLQRWDRELKLAGINPGTSADLTVACAMMAACIAPSLCVVFPAMPRAGMERVT
ncbi:triphosphoribosyl-dephospho-CoA synthase [Cupriavidus necator]|uniref:triphosphoribosyl-dephospho-CoA synthase n=1 Tax=Cupriavidus necator TaxID=106590 RepID=UPI00339D63F8